MIRRLSKAALATLAFATVLNSTPATAAAIKGDLYFVNVTKRAVSLTLDDGPRVAPFIGEVQGRPTVSGLHVLHIGVEGGPSADLSMTLDSDHVAQDENGRSFWCAIAAIDIHQQLRTVPVAPSNCSKLVAAGLHPPPPGEPPADLKGDLNFLNISGAALMLSIDGKPPGAIADRQGFGTTISPGAHDFHFVVGESRSVDVHLHFNAGNLGRDSRGVGYWCVGMGLGNQGVPVVLQLDSTKCSAMVGEAGPPTH